MDIRGKQIAFTGVEQWVTRDAVIDLLRSNGATYNTTVTNKTDLLLVGVIAGHGVSKQTAARERGLDIVQFSAFRALLDDEDAVWPYGRSYAARKKAAKAASDASKAGRDALNTLVGAVTQKAGSRGYVGF